MSAMGLRRPVASRSAQEMNQTLIMVAGIVLLLVVLGIIFFM